MRSRYKKKQTFFQKYIKGPILNGRTLPFIFTMAILGMAFVFTRMKGIEQDYQYSDLNKQIREKQLENKELKAERARELSIKKLRSFAKKFNLNEPSENHIIVIPKK